MEKFVYKNYNIEANEIKKYPDRDGFIKRFNIIKNSKEFHINLLISLTTLANLDIKITDEKEDLKEKFKQGIKEVLDKINDNKELLEKDNYFGYFVNGEWVRVENYNR